MSEDGQNKLLLLKIIGVSALGVVTAVAVFRRRQQGMIERKPAPRLGLTKSGRFDRLENFSSYVVRQLGFSDLDECPQIGKLAYDYLRKTKGSEDNIFAYFSNDPDAEKLYEGLIDEFDKCILSYFAFHWSHASLMVKEVLDVNSENKKRLKDFIMAATRKQRFERVTKDLKVTRVFSTLLEEMKAIRMYPNGDDSHCTDVMVPAALSERSPVLLLMGGGMGAGKSTVLKDILKESFWAEAAENAVVVEADAFKETDVIYRALSSRGHHDMLQTAELVHQSSTDAASSLLVTALNDGRDVIMDGTLSWEPFVEQMIAMARNVHRRRYRMGDGYKVADDGTITENYWEQVEEEEQENNVKKRKPYRIELVGVVCDAYLAVVRGIRRAILMGRAVRVKSQLTSHKRFANAFSRYCQLVDNARLYSTNAMGGPPRLIGWKDGENSLLVDPDEIGCLTRVCMLNENADSVHELYPNAGSDPVLSSIWYEAVLSPGRADLQKELKMAILKIENEKLAVTQAS